MRPTLEARFTLLLGVLLAFFLGGVAWLDSTHDAEVERGLAAAQEERSRLLDEIVSLASYPLHQFAKDYSLWDEMVTFVQRPDAEWARINLQASLATFRLHSIWVLRADGTRVHAVSAEGTSPGASPVSPPDLARLRTAEPFSRFHTMIDGVLCEVSACPIQPSADIQRTSPPAGWLVAAIRWDAAYLETISKLTGGTASLVPPDVLPTPYRAGNSFELLRPLLDFNSHAQALLRTSYRPPALQSAEKFNQEEQLIFVLQGLALIAVTAFCIHLWIIRPIRNVIASLRTDDPAPLADLGKRRDEIGLIARLVRSHFADRLALQRNERATEHTLAERVRLGRDLHDNVIQSLFATGMSVTATKSLVRTAPQQVEADLEKVRGCLNEIIRDVRTFIVGLEPSSLEGKTFSQAVAALADALRSIRTVEIETDIDDIAEQSLPPDLRRHALQLAREALLNSIRHTGATRLRLSLQLSGEHVELLLTDDGNRASPSDASPAGRGLAALVERADLVSAFCEVSPLPERGNRFRILYPQLHAAS